jgi:triosephosphate isomerase
MNKTAAEARAYVAGLIDLLPPPGDDLSLFFIPPFTALAAAREAIGDAPLLLGAQNMHSAESGAYTGEVSADMLTEFGVDLVELGHSERRAAFGETDAAVNAKVKTALRHGLRPLVCVGDTAPERDAGASVESIVRQVKLAFAGLDSAAVGRCLVAYEPVWAIGERGVPAPPEHVSVAHAAIRRALQERTTHPAPILYGGSVNADNAARFAMEQEVDGLFVGRAAWTARGLASIVREVVVARRTLTAAKSTQDPSRGRRHGGGGE